MPLVKCISVCLLTCCFFNAAAQLNPQQYTQQKNVSGYKGAVVSAHPLASQAGLEILQQGGNAVDAAITVQFALAVVYPGAGNLGGGGFLVAQLANGKQLAIDYRETAPGKASRDMYLDKNGDPVADASLKTRLASGVPGTVAGIFASLPYAKFPIRRLIAPAIRLAEQGFALTQSQADDLNRTKEKFLAVNKNPVAFVKSIPWKAGDILVQKDLANTLKRISTAGLKGFYEGKTAALLVAEMNRDNGIISLDDLKKYRAKTRKPMRFGYKNYEVLTMPLPSSGGIILQQLLKMTEHRRMKATGFHSPGAMQLMIEAERRAYADRAQYLGDPDFIKVPVKQLTDTAYLRQRMNDIIPGTAGSSKFIKAGIVHESMETTHLSIVDADGNAVSVTTTLNDHFGSKIVVTGAGFILNNEMDDFSIKPGVPNMYGAVGNEANAIAPGKRMLSSMTPTIVLKNKKPFIIVGTPGGTTIPTTVFQVLVNLLEFDLSPSDAVNNAKFHHQWLPDLVYTEPGFPENLAADLKKMGYQVDPSSRGYFGRVELIRISTHPKKIEAVADIRGDDDARAY
jgi:gamma-glutamyltranspeptidase/glutathione hydrolase